MKQLLITIFYIFIIISCKNKEDSSFASQRNNTVSSVNNDEEQYPDDTNCADVKYFNPNTGTHSTYRLTIDVESNEVVSVNFPNGGC